MNYQVKSVLLLLASIGLGVIVFLVCLFLIGTSGIFRSSGWFQFDAIIKGEVCALVISIISIVKFRVLLRKKFIK